MKRTPHWITLLAIHLLVHAAGSGAALAEEGQADRGDKTDKGVCVRAYDSAQRLKRAGAFAEAREQLVICGGPQCPAIMHGDCGRWLSEVEASTPTAVFQVRSKLDNSELEASVTIDQKTEAPLDGRAISFDLGEHELRFTAKNHAVLTRRYVFSEGEKLRQETVTLTPITTDAASTETTGFDARIAGGQQDLRRSRLSVPVVIAGTAALAGVGGFVYFGLTARHKDGQLGDCSPNCSHDKIDNTRQDYLLANVSGAVAIVGIATALILVLIDPQQDTSKAAYLFRSDSNRPALHRLPMQFEF
jgi:hypothetical protein